VSETPSSSGCNIKLRSNHACRLYWVSAPGEEGRHQAIAFRPQPLDCFSFNETAGEIFVQDAGDKGLVRHAFFDCPGLNAGQIKTLAAIAAKSIAKSTLGDFPHLGDNRLRRLHRLQPLPGFGLANALYR
jgi:hypothetical protein